MTMTKRFFKIAFISFMLLVFLSFKLYNYKLVIVSIGIIFTFSFIFSLVEALLFYKKTKKFDQYGYSDFLNSSIDILKENHPKESFRLSPTQHSYSTCKRLRLATRSLDIAYADIINLMLDVAQSNIIRNDYLSNIELAIIILFRYMDILTEQNPQNGEKKKEFSDFLFGFLYCWRLCCKYTSYSDKELAYIVRQLSDKIKTFYC